MCFCFVHFPFTGVPQSMYKTPPRRRTQVPQVGVQSCANAVAHNLHKPRYKHYQNPWYRNGQNPWYRNGRNPLYKLCKTRGTNPDPFWWFLQRFVCIWGQMQWYKSCQNRVYKSGQNRVYKSGQNRVYKSDQTRFTKVSKPIAQKWGSRLSSRRKSIVGVQVSVLPVPAPANFPNGKRIKE